MIELFVFLSQLSPFLGQSCVFSYSFLLFFYLFFIKKGPGYPLNNQEVACLKSQFATLNRKNIRLGLLGGKNDEFRYSYLNAISKALVTPCSQMIENNATNSANK
jgi:hypothetical protein